MIFNAFEECDKERYSEKDGKYKIIRIKEAV